jgi:RNA polymerase sigma-70 factor (ECF subfamily)
MAEDPPLSAGRAAWPGVPLDAERFNAWLAERSPGDAPAPHATDLYLACACAEGAAEALAAFEAHFGPGIDAALARMRLDAATIDDIRQLVRQKLFVAPAPAIRDYRGVGELGAWVRVVTVRTALNHLRDQRGELPLDEGMLLAMIVPGNDPELELMKRAYRDQFRAAFGEAVAALPARSRLLLSMHFIDGLPIERIGAVHRVHRTTASRWLADAQASLLAATRAGLMTRLHIGRAELDSIMRLIQSNLELNLDSLLK